MSYDFADRLIELRRQHGHSQEDLAKELGVSRQAISKWERAESTPDITNLVAIADLYLVSLDELVYGQDAAAREAVRAAEKQSDPLQASSVEGTAPSTSQVPEIEEAVPPTPQVPEVEEAVPFAPQVTEGEEAVPSVSQGGGMPPEHQAASPYVSSQPPTSPETKKHDPFYTFPYPILVVLLYLFLGFCFGLWHPGWVLFLTIPFYYWIVSVITHDPAFIDRRLNRNR